MLYSALITDFTVLAGIPPPWTSLLCGLVTIGFHVYVDNFCNYDALYGSIATVALFLFWLYIVSYILLLGAFLNRTLAHREETTRDESENA